MPPKTIYITEHQNNTNEQMPSLDAFVYNDLYCDSTDENDDLLWITDDENDEYITDGAR